MGVDQILNGRAVEVQSATVKDLLDAGAIETGSLDAKKITGDRLYAGAFDGADADARLDAAINEASSISESVTVLLESGDYNADRTVSTDISFVGTGLVGTATKVTGNWTLNGVVTVRNITMRSGSTFTVTGFQSTVENIFGSGSESIVVEDNRVTLAHLKRVDVTFTSDTSSGIVDTSTGVSVTDNGTNTVGDIA